MINTTIGKYKIIKLIGEGGMASVYEAEHEMLGTKVAIKILNPILSANAQIKERFRNEAKLMASLDQANITKVIDFDEQPGQLSIVMEYLNGEDLNDVIKKKGALSEKEIVNYFYQSLSALQYAHEKGVVHRDIKPSNIFVLPDGRIKILDFGIAKLFDSGNEMTQTGTQIGTPIYMSPEQVKADKSIDHRSDIYSLGVTMFSVINGKPPYDANTISQFDIFNKIVYEPLPDISGTGYLKELIKKACNKDRNLRFQYCQEWIDALNTKEVSSTQTADKTVAESPTSDKTIIESASAPTTDKTILETTTKGDMESSIKTPEIPKKFNKNKVLVFAIWGVLAILVIVAGILFFGQNDSKTYDETTYPVNITDIEEKNEESLKNKHLFSGESTAIPNPKIIERLNFNGKHPISQSENTTRLSQVSVSRNNITDDEDWFIENNLTLPTYTVYNEFRNIEGNVPENVPKKIKGLRISKGLKYENADIYFYGKNFSESSLIIITDKDKKRIEHCLDFSAFSYAPRTAPGDEDFVYQSVNWAIIENEILYISHGHNTYAYSSYGLNAYISAIDLHEYKILWTSEPLTCNSNFELIDSSIICGYGFTDESDYLYVLNKQNGRRNATYHLSSGPGYIIRKNKRLFVRTYNKNYEFSLE